LTERRDAYEFHVRQHGNFYDPDIKKQLTKELTVNYYSQKREVTEIKREEREEYQDIACHVLQDVVLRLDLAFQAFFDRAKKKQQGLFTGKVGYPRFKSEKRYDSFTYPDGAGWKLETIKEPEGKKRGKAVLYLTKIGDAPVTLHRPLEGSIKTVTIKREVDQWFVVFSCEVVESEKLPVSYEDVGIDLGVTHLATLSNGEFIEHPRHFRKTEKQLAQRQQRVEHKKRGSHRRKKAGKLVGKAHRKAARQRRDFLHKASHKLVQRYQVLVFEDIQTANLVRKPAPRQDENGKYLPNGAAAKSGLNKSILDAGWGTFVALCSSKAEEAGRTLVKVDPKFTSQICSQCGQVRKKDLSERWHMCDCGCELDRDVNAAVNILARGKQHLWVGKQPTLATA
jgi:putative transposase